MQLVRGRTNEEGSEYFLKAASGQLLVFREKEQFLWEALDGTSSFADIQGRYRSRFGESLANSDFAKFLAELIQAGAVERMSEGAPRVRAVTLAMPTVRKIELRAANGAPAIESGRGKLAGPATDNAIRAERARMGGESSDNMWARIKRPYTCLLGNPENLFDGLAAVFWPMRYLSWVMIPGVVLGVLICVKHHVQLLADMSLFSADTWSTPAIWLAEHFTALPAKIAEGMVIHGFGGRERALYLVFWMGIFVRFRLGEAALHSMTRRQKLWIEAVPLIWRLLCFVVAVLVWIMMRQTHPLVALVAFIEGFVAFFSFLYCACPILPLYGYNFLSILIGQEQLLWRALVLLRLMFAGRRAPEAMTVADRWGLALFGIATALFTIFFVGNIIYGYEIFFVGSFKSTQRAQSLAQRGLLGLGGWLAFGFVTVCALYWYSLWRFAGKIRALGRVARVGQAPAGRVPENTLEEAREFEQRIRDRL
jgi:hypothetical protein